MLAVIIIAIVEAIVITFLHKIIKRDYETITDLRCQFLRYKIEFYKSKLEVYNYGDIHRSDEQIGQQSEEEWGTISSSVTNRGMCGSDTSNIKVSKRQDKSKRDAHSRGTSGCNESEDATTTSI